MGRAQAGFYRLRQNRKAPSRSLYPCDDEPGFAPRAIATSDGLHFARAQAALDLRSHLNPNGRCVLAPAATTSRIFCTEVFAHGCFGEEEVPSARVEEKAAR